MNQYQKQFLELSEFKKFNANILKNRFPIESSSDSVKPSIPTLLDKTKPVVIEK